MRIVFCASNIRPEPWVEGLRTVLPEAQVEAWRAEDGQQADYAVVWAPPAELYATQPNLQAVFNIGAGVDALLSNPALPPALPVVRLEDAGMAEQMADYVAQAAIRFSRQFDIFEADMRAGAWKVRRPTARADYPVGIMGLGAIGARVAETLRHFNFPVNGWSRRAKTLAGVRCFAGMGQLDEFLASVRVLVCLLPLTPETAGILNRDNLGKLLPDAYLINVARGGHLVEEDLLALLESGHVAGATLDVFRQEPLPPAHPFWKQARITMTPHISARTLRDDTVAQIAGKIRQLQRGEAISGMVSRQTGY